MTKNKNARIQGQALIMLLFFVLIGMTITTAAVAIMVSNSLAATNVQQGEITMHIAESGAERAILQLLRNGSSYTGETLNNTTVPEWDSGYTNVITVSGSGPFTIDSTATAGKFVKKVEVLVHYVNNELIIDSWKDVN